MPVLTYVAETLSLTDYHLNSLQAMKMKYFKNVEGMARRVLIRNTAIRVSRKTVPLEDQIKKAQFCWFGHV